MYRIKLFIFFAGMLISTLLSAQTNMTFEEVNTKSYSLYEKGNWKELLQFGDNAIGSGQDFILLRLRLGYAAYMLNNFSISIKHYEAVIKEDSYNATAHYYLFLCKKYLNHEALADRHAKYLSEEVLKNENLNAFALTDVGLEVSYKQTDIKARENSLYARLDLGTRLGLNIHMVNALGMYNQVVRESKLTAVVNNNNIQVNQKEYYNKTLINVSNKVQLKAIYHFLNTPFNNFVYSNHVGGLGLTYFNHYYDISADANIAKLTDSTYYQYNVKLGLYPLGNLNFYSFSTGILRTNSNTGTAFNIKQVIGFKLMKKTWVEVNGTFGEFNNLLENDALYVYNAIDKNTFKAGGTLYVTPTSNLVLTAGYTYEKRELYKTLLPFNQHSITGGLSWKL